MERSSEYTLMSDYEHKTMRVRHSCSCALSESITLAVRAATMTVGTTESEISLKATASLVYTVLARVVQIPHEYQKISPLTAVDTSCFGLASSSFPHLTRTERTALPTILFASSLPTQSTQQIVVLLKK